MPPRIAFSFLSFRPGPAPSLIVLVPRPHLSVIRTRPPLVRTKVTVGTSAEGGVINIQQIPAPGSGYARVLLLNRPEARNAISRELLDTLGWHVDAIAAEKGNGPTRALVLASNVDAAFCAGADLKERKGMTKEEYGVLYHRASLPRLFPWRF
jgi:methylglutaconyl-CoA hydratase